MRNRTFQDRLNESLSKFKDNIAIQYKNRALTYAYLDKNSNYIANWIINKGINRQAFIGILMNDPVEFIAASIGILKAGCVFIPLDSALPASQLETMIDTSDLEIIVSDAVNSIEVEKLKVIEEKSIRLAAVGDLSRDKNTDSSWFMNTLGIQYTPEDKIYIYFTSGTSGKPKAILGKNKSLLHFIDWESETFGIDEGFRFSQFTTPGFDAFLRDIFVPLCSGGVTCIPGENTRLEQAKLAQWLDKTRINLIHCVPALFRFLKSSPLTGGHFKHLKFILLSGEKINPGDIEHWYAIFGERIQLVNFYGPTETTMIKTFYFIGKKDVNRERIPIGKPMKGARVIIFDKDMKVCDELAIGEIYIRTPYRTFGYYNEPELNKAKFIANPFTGNPDDILYKTGDLGRLLPDGNVDLIGRIDRQVKVRGIRVELEEIENVLMQSPLVSDAVTIKKNLSNENEILLAYITEGGKKAIEEKALTRQLKEYLSSILPGYMIPAQVIKIDGIPRKPNGKVDYEGLPDPFKDSELTFIPPRDHIEKKLAEIWSELLSIEKIGVNENFIELGGNSLNVMSLAAKIHREFDIRISIGEVFNNPVMARQAEIIRSASKEKHSHIPVQEENEYYDVSHAQKRLWLLSQFEDASLTFNIPNAYMVEGNLDKHTFGKALEALIDRHENLRTVFITVAGEPKQKILSKDENRFNLACIVLKGVEDRESKAQELVDFESGIAFDLSGGPLLKAKLIELEEETFVFAFTMHHIISDALSTEVMLRELLILYKNFRGGKENPLKPLRIQYKDYAAWHNEQLKKEDADQHKHYWLGQLGQPGELPLLNLPVDKERSQMTTYNGEFVSFHIAEALTGKLRTLARDNEVTLFMIFTAALNLLFYRYTGQRDIIIGTPAGGREHEDLEGQIGFYINTLALRTCFFPGDTFITLLNKVKTVSVEAFEHQGYPFDRLVHELGIQRDLGRHPIFDVVVDMFNYTPSKNRIEGSGLKVRPLKARYNKSKFDLTIYIIEGKDSLTVKFEYKIDLFQRKTMKGMIRRYRELINGIVENPFRSIRDLPVTEEPRFPAVKSTTGAVTRAAASYHQERLWFIDRFESGNLYESGPIYHNIPVILKINGELDVEHLEQSIRYVIKRHGSLRTRIISIGNKPFQQVEETVNFRLEVSVPADAPHLNRYDHALDLALEEAKRPFLMDKEALTRGKLIQIKDDEFILVITLHHIIADKYSLEILTREIFRYYNAGPDNRMPQPAGPLFSYVDFSRWQREWPDELLDTLFFYWKRKLHGKLQPLEIPTDHPRAMVHTFQAGKQSFTFPGALCDKIGVFTAQEGVGYRIVLLAAFKILLHRYSGQDEIVVGTSGRNREQPGAEAMIGPAANLLVLRSIFTGPATCRKLLSDLAKTVDDAYKYQAMPFDKLVLELNPQKDMSRTALFDVLFQYEENPFQLPEVDNLEIEFVETNLGWGKYDINLLIQRRAGGNSLSGILVYNADYYDGSSISRLIGHYKTLLENLTEDIDGCVSRLSLLTGKEKNQLLIEWNQTQANYPADTTIHQLFEKQSAVTPGKIAAVYEDTELTYRELNNQVNGIAGFLRDTFKCGPNDPVAVLLDRSQWLIPVLLGILKAGAAYVPIDPGYPARRIHYILTDSRSRLLITHEKSGHKIGSEFEGSLSVININSIPLENKSEGFNFNNPTIINAPEDTAYVIYTSGTTGQPKGCMISHRNVVRLIDNDKNPFDFNDRDVWIVAHSYCFDFSVWEMYGALLNGGKLIVPRREDVRDVDKFLSIIKQHKVSVLNQTPAAFYRLLAEEKTSGENILAQHLRVVIFGGDKLEPRYLKEWINIYPLRRIRLVNMYGITETTIHVTHYSLTGSDIDAAGYLSPIGGPLPETTIYIFNRQLNLQPIGVTGELYVGGSGVSRGYLNKTALTSERFIENPYKKGEIIYKTGDLGRRLPDGNIEFQGRLDHQVKIRGFRIERGEIESQLLNHDEITEALVIDREATTKKTDGQDKEKYLSAYIVSAREFEVSELREYLANRLPDYMIPSYFVQLAKIPLTANGKIDRNKLPEPKVGGIGKKYFAPGGEIEKALAGIWSDVLGVEEYTAGMDANFFELGGHSLKATILTSKIHKEFDVKIPLAEVFITPTIRGLSRYIEKTAKNRFSSIKAAEQKEYYALSSAQKRLYVIQQMDRESVSYNISRVVILTGELDVQKLKGIFKKFVKRHESFRTSFKLIKGQPVQEIHNEVRFSTEYIDAEIAGPEEIDEMVKNFIRPFDLCKAPLLRARLIRQEGVKHILMLDMHHTISDFVSEELLIRDFFALYRGEELAALRFQYKDYSEWQNRMVRSEEMKKQEKYWLKVFEGNIPGLILPTDYERPPVKSFEGDHISFIIDSVICVKLRELAKETSTTLYMVLLAVFNILLSRYTKQEDIVIGSPVSGRNHADLENIIGMFVNMLAIRNRPEGNKTFREFIEDVKENTLNAFENENFQFDELVNKLGLLRNSGENPLSEVVFNMLSLDGQKDAVKNADNGNHLKISPYKFGNYRTPFELLLNAREKNNTINMMLTYSTALFKKTTIEKMAHHYIDIVNEVLGDSDVKLTDIKISHDLLTTSPTTFRKEQSVFNF